MRRLVALVPAAGLSTRFGEANKLLQPYGASTVVGTVVATLLSAGLPVVVVTGHDAEAVREACPGAEFVFNPRFREGLGSSIAAGATAVGDVDGVLIALADMPGIEPAAVHALLECFLKMPLSHEPPLPRQTPGRDGDRAIIGIRYAGEPHLPRHPILFGRAHLPQLRALQGDIGAREAVRANREDWSVIDWPGRLDDFDTPADFG